VGCGLRSIAGPAVLEEGVERPEHRPVAVHLVPQSADDWCRMIGVAGNVRTGGARPTRMVLGPGVEWPRPARILEEPSAQRRDLVVHALGFIGHRGETVVDQPRRR